MRTSPLFHLARIDLHSASRCAFHRPKPLAPGANTSVTPNADNGITVLLIVGCLFLAYAVFWLWFDSGQVLMDLEEQVAQADLFVQGTISATTDSIGMKKAEEFKQGRLLLQQKQISWGEVFHTILDVPEGLVVDSIIQSDFTVMVDGRASNLAIANEYLTKLQDSGLFKEPQVQLEQISSVPLHCRRLTAQHHRLLPPIPRLENPVARRRLKHQRLPPGLY